ncbi:MAG: asp/Glu/Hydantoin racemase family protein [Rhodospirillales bacterium]|jgi:maleate isomerase|nr:asp/Glu/Hydantoin racemase family protein [Rhodospirillales bacterium]
MAEAAQNVEDGLLINRMHMPHRIEPGIAHRARIGLVVLASDHTIEHEWRRMLDIDGIAVYHSRIANSPTITPETLKAMEAGLTQATDVILPGVPLDVVAYGCTSGAMVIGEDKVAERIRAARPAVAVTTPITGALAAMRALNARRIALLTPYIDRINQMMRGYIQARGVEVPVMGSFNNENDNEVACIAPESLRDAAIELAQEKSVDAVFVACTSLRLAAVVEEIEQRSGKPALSSNHAMAWHALRLARYRDAVPGFGRLFRI